MTYIGSQSVYGYQPGSLYAQYQQYLAGQATATATPTTSTGTGATGSGSTALPAPPDAISTVTGIDPNEVAAATMGKIIPVWVGGMPRMGCHIIYGPTTRVESGVVLASFGVSFGMPANNLGDREIRELRLDGYKVWTLADGDLISDLTFRFYPGTETQAADPLVIAAYPGAPVAHKGQCLVYIEDLPLTDYANKIPFVSALIADITDGADPTDGVNLGDALAQVAASPYVNLPFEAVDISERVDAVIIAEKVAFIDLLVRYSTLFLWDVVQRDKLKIIERGTVTPDLNLDLTTILTAGGDTAPLVVDRQQQDELPKDLEYSYIDIDRDYEINTVRAVRPSQPVAVTVSSGVDTIALPSVHTAQEAISWVTLRAYKNENARDRASFTTGVYGYEIEPGDIVAVDAGFKNLVLRVTETLHGADWTNRITAEPVLRCATPVGSAVLDGVLCVSGAWSMSRQLLSSYLDPYYEATGSNVSRLYDQSGNERHFADPGSGMRPAVTTAGPNVRDVADFDGVDDFMTTGLDLSNFTTASASYIILSVIVDAVTLDDVDAQDNHALIGDAGKKLGIYARNTAELTLYSYNFNGSADSAARAKTLGVPLVISLRHEAGTLYIRTNNGVEVSTASGDTSDLTGDLQLALSGIGQNANMKLFEATTFNCVPPLGTRDAIEQNYMDWIGADADEVVVGTWTPADEGTVKAWYDFSDTATITASGSNIVAMLDKSGFGNHVVNFDTPPTTGTATLNGLNVGVFPGSSGLVRNVLSEGAVDLPNNNSTTLFVLAMFDSSTVTDGGLLWTGNELTIHNYDSCELGRDDFSAVARGHVMAAYGDFSNNSISQAAAYNYTDNTWHAFASTHTTASRSIYEDGTLKGSGALISPPHSFPDAIIVGRAISAPRLAFRILKGRIAQAIVVEGTTTATRQKLEGWVMWKYGLEAQLPTGHPYKSAPP